MSSVWCVSPEEEKLELIFVDPAGNTNPFWIKVKKRLTVGEERKVQTAGWRGLSGMASSKAEAREQGPEIQIDWKSTTFARAEAYLTDWSLSDDKGKKLPVTREVIETLHPDVFDLIENAISAHVKAMADEKKLRTGSAEPSATSA
jgi:hypothetical protein